MSLRVSLGSAAFGAAQAFGAPLLQFALQLVEPLGGDGRGLLGRPLPLLPPGDIPEHGDAVSLSHPAQTQQRPQVTKGEADRVRASLLGNQIQDKLHSVETFSSRLLETLRTAAFRYFICRKKYILGDPSYGKRC